MRGFRSFAIVPAAGISRRMAQPKLLLNWHGQALMQRVLSSWTASRVSRTVIVVHPDHDGLATLCRSFDVDVVIPREPPREMKHSVHIALRHVASCYCPAPHDAWLLSPADLPRLSSQIINRVIDAYDACQPAVVSPTHGGHRGHPVLFPWSHAARAKLLDPDQGLNALMRNGPVQEIECDDPAICQDVDTLEDYRRLLHLAEI